MKRRKVAVLIASIDREYQQDYINALSSACSQYELDVFVFNSQGHMNVAISTSEAGESAIYSLPDLNDFDAVVSLQATMGNEFAQQQVNQVIRMVQDRGMPHISIDVPTDGAVTIMFDDMVSVEEVTEHLLHEHGVQRVAFVCGPRSSPVSRVREDACREVLKKHGICLAENMIFDGEWTRVGGRKAAEVLIGRGEDLPDAVICANDDMALSVIETFGEHDIRVPRDIKVTGFDALREAVMRGVTTICRPIDRAARKTVELLVRWMDGEKPEQDVVTLPTIPVYGETCGCTQRIEQMNEKLRLMGMERWNMETILTRVSMFSGVLAAVGDEDEAEEKIADFVASWDIREFYLCIDPSVSRETDGSEKGGIYPRKMLLLFGIHQGKRLQRQIFSTRDLIPGIREEKRQGCCLVFCPLYYRDRNFGYVAIEPGTGTGSPLYSILMLMNGALMSLYLQTNIKRYAATIEHMAVRDIMTGMLNRRGFMSLAPATLEEARKTGKAFAVLSSDMDHMKEINDHFGHLKGDEAIIRFGQALKVLEKYGMTPVHISGDEFLAYGITDTPEDAQRMIGVLRNEMDRVNREDPWIRDMAASIGIYAAVPLPEDVLDRFMTQADRAMYADKQMRKHPHS